MSIVWLLSVLTNYESVLSNTDLSLCLSKALPMSRLIVLTFYLVSHQVDNNPPRFIRKDRYVHTICKDRHYPQAPQAERADQCCLLSLWQDLHNAHKEHQNKQLLH